MEGNADAASVSAIARELRVGLGAPLTAFITGATAHGVQQWALGSAELPPACERPLRTAYDAFVVVADADSPAVARAWFMGMNPELGDESPAEALSEARYAAVMAAARSHARTG